MNGYYARPKREKTPVGFWILLAAAAVLTVALGVFLVVTLLRQVPAQAGSSLDREFYTQEDRWEYWRGFDATALAAVVCDVYPDADGCILAEGADENFLALTVDTEQGAMKLHFSLRSANMTFFGGYEGYDRGFAYTSRVYEDVENPQELALYYGDHLRDRGARVVSCIERDVDGDGQTEYVYLVENMMDSWLSGGDGTPEQLASCADMLDRTVCVYLDAVEENLYVHSFCLGRSVDAVDDALWDNGILHLEDGQRLFVAEPELCLRSYADAPDTLRRLCLRYSAYLEDRGYTDVRMALADVSLAPGQEMIYCYSDGSEYTTAVYTARYGRLQELYSKRGGQGSVFLVVRDGVQYLLDYSQSLSASDYSLTYAYSLFTFDESFNRTVFEADSIWVAADQGGGQAGSDFFRRVNGYLDSAKVCYDPYGLTGYTLMQGSAGEESDTRYLNITNCSTNKIGVVTLRDDDSFLHLRSGPSTKHDIVLIDPGDEDSCVKQVQGSLVTVIMPHNTGDRDNPIWAQIQISYQNRTMVGCSSQRYIRIEGIRHLEPGQQFTIEVDNYDSALTWTSSDDSVASIDPVSGTLTAHRSGLVLITVRSEAGLEDSCLIMVD